METISPSTVIELQQVSFAWADSHTPTLMIEDLQVQRGEHLFIKGPSGCGKSTLLGLLTGINQIQSGELSVLGHNLSQLSSAQRDRFRADNIGYIFQQFNLLPYLNVIENVTLPCQFSVQRRQRAGVQPERTARELLEKLHLSEHLLHKPVVELSIGQQQRVAAARALIGQPPLIIADEPTSSLDHENRTAFIELLLAQVNQVEGTLVFVSHDPTLEPLFDRSLDLRQINQVGAIQ